MLPGWNGAAGVVARYFYGPLCSSDRSPHAVFCVSMLSGVARLWSQGGHRGPRAKPRLGYGSESPRSQTYTDSLCNCQILSTQVVAESALYLPYPPPTKKTSDLRESHDPTWSGQDGHVPTRGYTTEYAKAQQVT